MRAYTGRYSISRRGNAPAVRPERRAAQGLRSFHRQNPPRRPSRRRGGRRRRPYCLGGPPWTRTPSAGRRGCRRRRQNKPEAEVTGDDVATHMRGLSTRKSHLPSDNGEGVGVPGCEQRQGSLSMSRRGNGRTCPARGAPAPPPRRPSPAPPKTQGRHRGHRSLPRPPRPPWPRPRGRPPLGGLGWTSDGRARRRCGRAAPP